MLILPSRLHRQANDLCTSPTATTQTAQSPQPATPSQPQERTPCKMISVIPPATPATSKRPKLSLQTSTVSSLPVVSRSKTALTASVVTGSPTIRNTHLNTSEIPPLSHFTSVRKTEEPLLQSRRDEHRSSPSLTPSANSGSSGHVSPFPSTTPYCLPIGSHSILRNSPLPRRHQSATSTRARRMFPPVKRVIFHERLEEIIISKVVGQSSESSDSDSSEKRRRTSSTEDEVRERRAVIEEEDGSSTPVHGRRKRRREWVWRPFDDDVLVEHQKNESDLSPLLPPAEFVPGSDKERLAAASSTDLIGRGS